MNKNLIYVSVSYQESYIDLLYLLIESIFFYGKMCMANTDILIITSRDFEDKIKKKLIDFDLPIKYFIVEINEMIDSMTSRLLIFRYENINKYGKILYLDTDILINRDINTIFDTETNPNKLYALEEGIIGGEWWGREFFDFNRINPYTSAFSSGVLFFHNSIEMIGLFQDINDHIEHFTHVENKKPSFYDQPFIVYNAISKNKYDNQFLKKYVELNPSPEKPHDKIIYHFAAGPGGFIDKYKKMTMFNRNRILTTNNNIIMSSEHLS